MQARHASLLAGQQHIGVPRGAFSMHTAPLSNTGGQPLLARPMILVATAVQVSLTV
jgi:hypothetical protein